MTPFDLKGKTALVTGANRGIGKAFVEHLVNNGASRVYAGTRDAANFDSLSDINADIVLPVLLDVTCADHIKALATKADSLDVLINNAGIANSCFFSDENAIDIARVEMETNYFAPLNLIQAFLPKLKQSKGVIINMSSIAGISSFPGIGPYSASKAALLSLTQGLRIELHAANILVAGVYPGPIDTRMAEDFAMEKPPASQVPSRTFDAIKQGQLDIFPDSFSAQMYETFLKSPAELAKVFAGMLEH